MQLAVPDGVAAVPVDLWDEGLAAVPTIGQGGGGPGPGGPGPGGGPADPPGVAADYGDGAVEVALVSTTGIRSTNRKTSGFLSVGVIAGEGDASQTGGGFSVGRGFEGLDPDRATADAVERAVRMLGATKGPSGRNTVVFDRRVATTLLSVISSALSGEAVAKGRSFFAGRIGEQVGGAVVTLVDDPTDPRAYGAASYDAEGLACRRNELIDRRRAARASSTTPSPAHGPGWPPPARPSGVVSPEPPGRGAGR